MGSKNEDFTEIKTFPFFSFAALHIRLHMHGALHIRCSGHSHFKILKKYIKLWERIDLL